uniref:hypothetical protein n=1 Tax=Arthrobacter sp. TaxID=1667 RepID=UPI002583A79A
MNGIPGSGPGQERFQRLLRRWDASPRQGIPQLSGDVAVFLWRGRDDPQPTLHLASASALRNAWDLRSGPPPEASPGTPLPAPDGLLVRGFALAPDGRQVAALLSGVGEELARVWLLAHAAEKGRHLPPVRGESESPHQQSVRSGQRRARRRLRGRP